MRICTDPTILASARSVVGEFGFDGLTLGRLAEAAGHSRMTLHRRDVSIDGVVAGLSLQAAAELRDALFPVLASTGPAALRLEAALVAMCDVSDRHLPLLAGLFSADEGIFHGEPDASGALPTLELFVSPFAKLLADGAIDGSLLRQVDNVETATVLFNTVGWGYIQLRHSQRWSSERARSGVITMVMTGLSSERAGS